MIQENILKLTEYAIVTGLIQPEDRDIFHAVMEQPEKYRTVVSLHYFEGYSFREIAEFLHIGISAVSMRLHRAKNILKKQLGRD